ncbi:MULTISPECIES: SDR family oxidoreductase [Micrococcaceae]|uniref:SDR family oxidoreductase n=1 Tax=unclassified Kocuria TaxID=2649579 RepID=UPI00101166AF|nr:MULTISPECIES: SDR family oxidoreductase [unclassified Kocuria]
MPEKQVVVIIGVGAMGEAIARRQGAGSQIVLADFDEDLATGKTEALRADGFDAIGAAVDVSARESVRALADKARALGPITQVVHTAGLSPVQAPVDAILRVDLLGVAIVLEEFSTVISAGGAGVIISSMAGHMKSPMSPEVEFALATAPADELLALPFLSADSVGDTGAAYGLAKRANQLRVQAASRSWGAQGARINSISPGIISTAMGQLELSGENGQAMLAMIGVSGTGRIGTPSDIADAAAFLLSRNASFVTGTDLLVDGGVVGAVRTDPNFTSSLT